MKRVDYDENQHAVYLRGRSLSPDRMAVWVDAFDRLFPAHRPLTVADVGCGVGRFTPVLADVLGGPVYGVEPSARMREQAEVHAAHPAVRYLEGRAEAIPLDDAACDAALVFLVWHHVEDKDRGAAELLRIVKPGGTLFLRTAFGDRLPDLWWYPYIAGVADVERAVFQPEDVEVGQFTRAGWRLVTREVVFTPTTFGQDYEMLRLRSISTLEHLPEADVERGLAAIAAAIEGREDEPAALPGQVVVFERPT